MDIKTIKQTDASGCGIACVSALTSEDYDRVKNTYEDIVIGMADANLEAIGSGLTRGQLVDLLDVYGLDIPVIKGPAIVIVGDGVEGHYIAITKEGEIINPTFEANE